MARQTPYVGINLGSLVPPCFHIGDFAGLFLLIVWADISRARQPQLFTCIYRKLAEDARLEFPQSQRHRQITAPVVLRVFNGLLATKRPKRCPFKFFIYSPPTMNAAPLPRGRICCACSLAIRRVSWSLRALGGFNSTSISRLARCLLVSYSAVT